MRQRRLRDAQTTLERSIGLNPAEAAVQNDLGVVYLEQNNLPAAERAFRRALALEPSGNTSRYNLGVALYRMNRGQEASEQFRLGSLNAGQRDAVRFQNAMKGVLQAPLPSPLGQTFQESS